MKEIEGRKHSLPLATVNPSIMTVEQLDTEAAAAAEATVQVALFATSTGEGTRAKTEGTDKTAKRSDERSILESDEVRKRVGVQG